MVSACETVCGVGQESVAVTLKVAEPETVGVPESKPVPVLIVKPVGGTPVVPHVIAPRPPWDWKVN